jgi:hypothetical protein
MVMFCYNCEKEKAPEYYVAIINQGPPITLCPTCYNVLDLIHFIDLSSTLYAYNAEIGDYLLTSGGFVGTLPECIPTF